jgi:hypothetical protein
MQLTIDIKESALDKVMYLLNNLKSDIKIVDTNSLDIEAITDYDQDCKYILDGRKERDTHPENYGTMNDINWN